MEYSRTSLLRRASRHFPPWRALALSAAILLMVGRLYVKKPTCDDVSCSLRRDDVINLVVVACEGKSGNTFIEAETMIKSAALFSRSRFRVHVFTTSLGGRFEEEISGWPRRVRDKFDLSVHFLRYPLEPEEEREMKGWWGPCASFRLFLPDVMQETDAVLYVDTDVIFLSPIEEVWGHFYKFDARQVGALAPRVGWDFKVPGENPNFIRKPNGKLTQVNSGVFLMNLTRMREPVFRGLSSALQPWGKGLLFPLYRSNIRDMFGDQNLINVVFHHNPDLIHFLPCKFNYHHKFCFDGYRDRFCDSAERDGAAVVHGNANTYYNNYAPAFKAINDAMRQYNFEADLRAFLYDPMRRKLKDPDVEGNPIVGTRQNCSSKF